MLRRMLVVLFCFAVSPLSSLAQQSTLSETLEIRLIEFEAFVTDRRGNPVYGLGPEDFDLYENGRRQAITNFSEIRDGEDVTARFSSDAPAPVVTPPQQARTIVVLVDAFRLPGAERKRLFANLQKIVDRTMREGDRGQVLTWHDLMGLRALTDMTRSRAEVVDALTEAEKTHFAEISDLVVQQQVQAFRELAVDSRAQGGLPFDGEDAVEWAVTEAAQQELSVMRRKTAAIQRILPAMAAPGHRNVLIYVSGTFPMVAGKKFFSGVSTQLDPTDEDEFNTGAMLQAITRTANAHDVIVYALRPELATSAASIRALPGRIDIELGEPPDLEGGGGGDRTFGSAPLPPRLSDSGRNFGLQQNDVRALAVLAEETGGTVAVGRAGIAEAVERIPRDLGSYYTLAYRAQSDGSDRERRIELRPKDRRHRVRAQRSIIDRSDAARARDLLVARLFEHGAGGDLEFDIQTGAAKPAPLNQLLIPVELTIPVEQLRFEDERDERAARFSVLLVAGANIGEITRMKEASRRIVAEPGTRPVGVVRFDFELLTTPTPTNVSIAVFDEKSGLAGVQTLVVEAGEVRGEAVSSAPAADSAWRKARLEAARERKPILVYFRPRRCGACERFEQRSLQHPAIQRRLSDVVFVQLPPTAGELAKVWNSRNPGLAVFDRLGEFRLHYEGVPSVATLGTILDDIHDIAPHLERAAAEADRGRPADGDLDVAIAYMLLGRRSAARTAVDRAIEGGGPETRQYGRIARALLDAREGAAAAALEAIDRLVDEAMTPEIAGDAWLAGGLIHRWTGSGDESAQALATARTLLEGGSRIAGTSDEARAALEVASGAGGTIRILPPEEQLVSGSVTLRTRIASAEIAAVDFFVDGVLFERVKTPPFSARIDFGQVPEQRTVRAIAFDGLGNEAGRDELVVNEGGERFWFRLIEPPRGAAGGATFVKAAVRAPATRPVRRVTVSWNDVVRTVLTSPPWETTLHVPPGELGVLRAVAELADGRSAEDAVLLNAQGHVERTDVQLVELPVTVGGAPTQEADLEGKEVRVREGSTSRIVDSIHSPAEARLTVGLVIDTSGSMQKSLLEVQEAAIEFLDTVLTDEDRALIVSFATRAELVQPATSEKARLERKILGLRPGGSTALCDAIAVGLLQLEGVKGRRALVVFTDGLDRTSRYGATEVGELARRTHVPIHLIAAEPDAEFETLAGPGSRTPQGGLMYRELSRMAESTGGSAHRLGRIDELPQAYERIEAALRSQFLLFIRTDPAQSQNDWRKIQVDVASRDVTIHAPEGYYAPW